MMLQHIFQALSQFKTLVYTQLSFVSSNTASRTAIRNRRAPSVDYESTYYTLIGPFSFTGNGNNEEEEGCQKSLNLLKNKTTKSPNIIVDLFPWRHFNIS
jgi:hypothetical protein